MREQANEVNEMEVTAVSEFFVELAEMQLALVGGGIGTVTVA